MAPRRHRSPKQSPVDKFFKRCMLIFGTGAAIEEFVLKLISLFHAGK